MAKRTQLKSKMMKQAILYPESIQLALEKLGIQNNAALMVGDSQFDIQAGKSAGVGTIGVTYGFLGKRIKDHT